MKMTYSKPVAEVEEFALVDILTASFAGGNENLNGGWEDDANGGNEDLGGGWE